MRFSTNIFCALLLLFFSSCSVDETETDFDLTENMVAHYPFDGSTEDLSKFAVEATAKGATLTHDRFANPEHAFAFDGIDDFIEIPANDHINFESEFTINMWIKTNSTYLQQILFKNVTETEKNVAAYGISLGYTPEDGKTDATNDIVFSVAPRGIEQELREFDYEQETWYMITCIMKDDTMYLYVNGKPALLKFIEGTIDTTSMPLLLGIGKDGSLPFNGSMDDLRMYSEAKSVDFVKYLYEH